MNAPAAPYLLQPRAPLLEARFTARFDRFISELTLGDGTPIRAHCVNPGRMEGLVIPGAKAWVSKVPDESKRKLRYTLELLEADGRIVGANSLFTCRSVYSDCKHRCFRHLRASRLCRLYLCASTRQSVSCCSFRISWCSNG